MAPPLVNFVRGGTLTANSNGGLSDPIGAAIGDGKKSKSTKNGRPKNKKSRVCAEGKKCKYGGVIGDKQHFLRCSECDAIYHRRCQPQMSPAKYSNFKKTTWNCGCGSVQLPSLVNLAASGCGSFQLPFSSQSDLGLDLDISNIISDEQSGSTKDSQPTYQSEVDFNSMKGQKFGHLNIQSIRRDDKFEELKYFLIEYQFLVFSLNETWLKKNDRSSKFEIPGYNLMRFDRQKREGGGSCFYVREDCIAKLYHLIHFFQNM